MQKITTPTRAHAILGALFLAVPTALGAPACDSDDSDDASGDAATGSLDSSTMSDAATNNIDGGTAPGMDTGTPTSPALYAVFTQVEGPDDSTTYLGLTDSLSSGELAVSQALESPGGSRFYAPEAGGFFAIADGESFSITRYDVTADRMIREVGRVSFAQLGVQRMHYRAVFLSESKAYYIDHTQGQIVIWNPTAMTVTGTIPLPDQITNGYQDFTTILPYFQYPVVQGRLFIPVSWYNYDAGISRDVTGLAVVDTNTDALLSYTETNRCPAATELAFDDNGDVYYGTNVNYPYYSNANSAEARAAARPGCIMRIRAGAAAFDESYLLRIADIAGGRVGMGLANAAQPGFGYIQVLNEQALPWASIADEDSFWESAQWEWWKVDLANSTAAVDPQVPAAAPYIKSFDIDGKRYIVRQTGEDRSTLYELADDGQHRPGFSSIGQITGIARVR